MNRDNRHYSYYAFAKAMRLALPQEVTHLSTGLDWYGDENLGLARILVDRQNADGSWPYDGWPYVGERTSAAWNVIILTRTLFEKPPVGVIRAEPNPGAVGQGILFDASSSYHVDPAKQIIEYLWDFDSSDGVDFDHPDATGTEAIWGYSELSDYQVSLKVVDNSTPPRFDTTTLTVYITIPPHPPTAVIGGPYLAAVLEDVHVDGSGSYDIDESEGDSIIAWDWESDFVAPYDFDEAGGENAVLPPFASSGRFDIALRVTDNTEIIFPQSAQPNLTNTAYGEVNVYTLGVEDLAARPKGTKCQLTWTHIGANAYKILRSEIAPNEGYEQIGTTASTYSTFLDYNLVGDAGVDVNRCLGDLNGDGDVDGEDQAIFNELVSTLDLDADLNGDGIVDMSDVEFFAAEYGRTDCFSDNGIELNKDYWYRVMADIDGETVISVPVYVYSQGRITNLPPIIDSEAVLDAQESALYSYDVQAYDPEGENLTYLLDLSPDGMTIDSVSGLITWTPSRDQVGAHDVMIRVRDASGISATQFYQMVVSPRDNDAPTANPEGPYEGLVHEELTFTGSGADPEGDAIVDYHWVFGDGTDAHGATVTHTYVAQGLYTVTLYVVDDRGATGNAETSCQIGLPNRPPIANAGGPYEVEINQPITFDGSQSYDPDADDMTYTWNFGDSSSAVSGVQVSHVYDNVGTYEVSLEVDDRRGGVDTATVDVVVTPPNQSPTASFIYSGLEVSLETMTFDGRGSSDSDGSIVSYSWDFGDGDSANGTQVDHAYEQVGQYQVVLRVTDSEGAWSEGYVYVLVFVTTNHDPSLQVTYQSMGVVGREIPLSAIGTDPDGDELTYSWNFGDGASGNGPELYHIYDAEGTYNATATVSDGRGGEGTLAFQVEIVSAPQSNVAPTADAGGPYQGNISEAILFDGKFSYDLNGDDLTYSWDFDASDGIQEDATGVDASNAYPVAGTYTVTLTVSDDTLESTDTAEVQVLDPADTTPPVVMIDTPAMDAVITAPIDIVGTVTDTDLDRWSLSYAETGSDDFTEFASGETEISSDTIAQFDPTLLMNGFYQIRLFATNLNGKSSIYTITVQVKGKLKVGLFTVSFTDLSIPLAGIPIDTIRTYDSRERNKSYDFGYGWALSVKTHPKVSKSSPEGEGWPLQNMGGFGGIYTYCITPTKAHAVSVDFPDGRTLEFDFTPSPNCQAIIPLQATSAGYTARPGTVAKLEPVGDRDLLVIDGYLYTYDMQLYDPKEFKLTLEDGTAYWLTIGEGVDKIQDRNGNLITITEDGITHSSGASVPFTRDAFGRITSITDPSGASIAYSYDGNGDLISMTDRLGNTTTFSYDGNHYLEEIQDPLGNRASRHEYDESGKLIATIDAEGNRIEMSYDLSARQEVLTDRLGNVTTQEYDSRGNITAKIDALGNRWEFTYDQNDNRLTQTDPLGNVTSFAYDVKSHLLTETDPLGNVAKTYTYDSIGNQTSYANALGNKARAEYDERGNLIRDEDQMGGAMHYSYDAAGNEIGRTNAMGHTVTSEFDALGNKTKVIYPLGNEIAYTYDASGRRLTKSMTVTGESGPKAVTWRWVYDAEGRIVEEVFPDGSTIRTDYNAIGKKSSVTDRNGLTTTYAYDVRGMLTQVTYPDGSTEEYRYDVNGNRTWEKCRDCENVQGVTYAYDSLNRMISETYPDGSQVQVVYDAAGRIIERSDENGNVTWGEYDAAGRVVRVTDAIGNQTLNEYDAAGRKIAMTDPLGRKIRFKFNEAGIPIKTIFPDGTTKEVLVDILGRKISETDQAGRSTHYEYDALGRLAGVIDPAGNEYRNVYDELGNKVQQIDANGHVTRWTYDDSGRVLSRTLPLGMTEYFSYDDGGRLIGKKDFNGETTASEYNSAGRLVRREYPDGSIVSYTYTTGDKISTVTDATGTTQYEYDSKLRLLSETKPDGTTVSYTYDAVGNRLSVATPRRTTNYSYDALNRLIQLSILDGSGRTTQYEYDAVGNRIREIHSNGVIKRYEYDSLNRLISMVNEKQDGTVISSYSYTLGPAGNKLRVEENYGRIVNYTYDSLYRLIEEGIVDPVNGNDNIAYSYDNFGNRLTKTNISGTILYTYDDNDRLLREEGPGFVNTFTYDSNGNLLTRSDGVNTEIYSYDPRNRLISIQKPGNAISYAYDDGGLRISQNINGTITKYIYDKNRKHPQVLDEVSDTGDIIASYTWGDTLDPIFMDKDGSQFSYLTDGNLNVRKLSDINGDITDTWELDAFGKILARTGATENSYLLHGQHFDVNSGFYYMRARWMDPNSGTFTTQDPFVGYLFEPRDLHKYAFARNNAVRFQDPSGLATLLELVVVVSIIGLLIGSLAPYKNPTYKEDMNLVNVNGRYIRMPSSIISRIEDDQVKKSEFLQIVGQYYKVVEDNSNKGMLCMHMADDLIEAVNEKYPTLLHWNLERTTEGGHVFVVVSSNSEKFVFDPILVTPMGQFNNADIGYVYNIWTWDEYEAEIVPVVRQRTRSGLIGDIKNALASAYMWYGTLLN